MDIFLAKEACMPEKKKEHMNGTQQKYGLSNLSYFLFSIISVWLCWNRNTAQNETLPMKILYCIIAFMFPIIYIIYYLFTKKKK